MIIDVQQADYDEVAQFMAAAVEYDTTAGTSTARDLADGALLFKLVKDAQVMAGYSLRINQYQLRRVCWILAAGGRIPGADLTRATMPIITEQAVAAGADQLAMITKRPGLVRKLQSIGFTPTGIVMRKNLA